MQSDVEDEDTYTGACGNSLRITRYITAMCMLLLCHELQATDLWHLSSAIVNAEPSVVWANVVFDGMEMQVTMT